MDWKTQGAPERKYHQPETGLTVTEGRLVAGYASLFGKRDQGGDVVMAGAYKASLKALADGGRAVKMLWQHDPSQPIGVWDVVREDANGLWVKGRILLEVEKGREAAALLAAGRLTDCRSATARSGRNAMARGSACCRSWSFGRCLW